MATNKVILNNEVLIDLTADTAVEANVESGKTFHKADGTIGTGTLVIEQLNLQEKTVIKNGEVFPDEEYSGLSKVTVNIPVYHSLHLKQASPTTITFIIMGTEYQTEPNMTWAEWCNSEYNTGCFIVNSEAGNRVCWKGSLALWYGSYIYAYGDDIIQTEYPYKHPGPNGTN
jgi:hypothetical protein